MTIFRFKPFKGIVRLSVRLASSYKVRALFTSVFILLLSGTVLAQDFGRGIGVGIMAEYGANIKSDFLIWDVESEGVPKYPNRRLFVGPVLQFKNYQKIQAEIGFIYGQTTYENLDINIPSSQNVTINEFQVPLRLVYNGRPPFQKHSALVYHAGLQLNYMNIPAQGAIFQDHNFLTPALTAGIRLSTEITRFGRLEYGVSYLKSTRDHHSFMIQDDDAVPAQASIMQNFGQIRLNLIYFFMPRTFNWTKSRYKLKSLD